mmetsp:Transcript_2119/g.4746  ORF Transcript_2119/g.4746 Transcript_2119/m.4746 type:complete len:162 (-) Transcript_2119:199-684(-)
MRPFLLFALASYASVSDGKDILVPEEKLSKTASTERSSEISRRSEASKSSKSSKSSESSSISRSTSKSSKSGKSSGPSLVSKSAKNSSKTTKSSSTKTSQSAMRRRKGGPNARKKNDSDDLDEILSDPDIAASLGVEDEEDVFGVMEAEWGRERVEMLRGQ